MTRMCDPAEGWEEQIQAQLEPWRAQGISWKLFEEAVDVNSRRGQPSAAIGFYSRRAYLLRPLLFEHLPRHHVGIVIGFLRAIVALETLPVPDVEFVFSVSDVPTVKLINDRIPMPLLRYCTREGFADIAIPAEAWYTMQDWDERVMSNNNSDVATPQRSWSERIAKLGTNAGRYRRLAPWNGIGGAKGCFLFKRSDGLSCASPLGTDCRNSSEPCLRNCTSGDPKVQNRTCDSPRQYFRDVYAPLHRDVIDVDTLPFRVEDWVHKYVLHLDGVGCSTRLQLYLGLGYATFVEQSGLRQHFSKLMVPFRDYVPVWNQSGPDLVDRVHWSRANDERVRRIGIAARRFAQRHLGPGARQCYWLLLLQQLRRHLTYTPTLAKRVGAYPLAAHLFPVDGVRPHCAETDHMRYSAERLPSTAVCAPAFAANWTLDTRYGKRGFQRLAF